MTSKREQILQAVHAAIVLALPFADVERNREKDKRIGPGGFVNQHDGELVENGVDLSPVTYHYELRIPVELIPDPMAADQTAALDALMEPVGHAFDGNPFLGGLSGEPIRFGEPDIGYVDATGTPVSGDAIVTVIATFSSPNPLV